jgi:hypothetical protein
MINFLKTKNNIQMKNLKTTLTGLIGGLIVALPTIIQSAVHGTNIEWKQIGLGIAFAALGLLSKDFNVTGGTVDQTTK